MPTQDTQKNAKKNFFEFETPEDLANTLVAAGFEKFRAKQIFRAVYKNKVFNPLLLPALPKELKEWLAKNMEFAAATMEGDKLSADETKKFLFKLHDGRYVESVLLKAPNDDGQTRKTLCISTQVGCASACKFCASALGGFIRNLTAAEIVSQALPFATGSKFDFENIVVMGMGEPLMNYDNLMRALKTFNDAEKFEFGARRITVSTCGIAPVMRRMAAEKFPFRLAISLHGASDDVRSRIMPINAKFPLAEVIEAAQLFAASNGRMVTLEYILIENVNDSPHDAEDLARIALSLHAHVNLIPYNKVPSLEWNRSPLGRRLAFAKVLENRRVSYTLRREKGSEIDAACGQLVLRKTGYKAE